MIKGFVKLLLVLSLPLFLLPKQDTWQSLWPAWNGTTKGCEYQEARNIGALITINPPQAASSADGNVISIATSKGHS